MKALSKILLLSGLFASAPVMAQSVTGTIIPVTGITTSAIGITTLATGITMCITGITIHPIHIPITVFTTTKVNALVMKLKLLVVSLTSMTTTVIVLDILQVSSF